MFELLEQEHCWIIKFALIAVVLKTLNGEGICFLLKLNYHNRLSESSTKFSFLIAAVLACTLTTSMVPATSH